MLDTLYRVPLQWDTLLMWHPVMCRCGKVCPIWVQGGGGTEVWVNAWCWVPGLEAKSVCNAWCWVAVEGVKRCRSVGQRMVLASAGKGGGEA